MPGPAPPPVYRLVDQTYAGSLLPISQHHPGLLWLMRQPVTEQMKECVISKTREVVDLDCEVIRPWQKLLPSHSALPSPPVTPTKPGFDLDKSTGSSGLLSLEDFLHKIVEQSRVHVSTLLCTLIYLDRIQPRIPPVSGDSSTPSRMPDARHRVLLATLICAAKYLNDSSPKNKHWAVYSSLFRCDEINLMEHQMLCLLNWDLHFTEEDCIRTFSMFFQSSVDHPPTPPYEDAHRPVVNSQLTVPVNRRASRPARIEINAGPTHLHPSYSCSSMAGGAPISPPPSASRSSFGEAPKEDGEEDELISRTNPRYATYGYPSSRPSQDSRSIYVPPPRYAAQAGSRLRHEEAPSSPEDAQENQLSSTTSWPALSVRANGFLERVWGGSQTGRANVKNSRSIGGIFRTSQVGSSASRI
ncbi:Cyclin, N-terminal domain [Ceratobasidium sp. AG-Ba]|nr:Cyclin, N-terminal domain [Ceratobasidium sp. AG-Ba]